jgi:hypothetical protein
VRRETLTGRSLRRLLALTLIGVGCRGSDERFSRAVPQVSHAAARFKEWLATRYHTPQDDLGQPMDLESGARQAQFGFLVGLEIADADERPAWKRGDFFERTFAEIR